MINTKGCPYWRWW